MFKEVFLWHKKEETKQQNLLAIGEGSLYKSEKLDCWIYQYHDNNGNRKTMKQKKNESVKNFKAKVTELKNKLNNGTYIQKNTKTMLQILDEYVDNKYKNNTTSARTYKRDTETIKQLKKHCPEICNKPIQNITAIDIKKISPKLTCYSNNSIDKIWRFVKRAFKIAISDRLITYNPMDNVEISKPKSDKITASIESLSTDEQKRFVQILTNTQHEYNNILLLQLQTGMRIGEVLALTKDCINIEKGEITIYRTLTRDANDNVIMGKTAKTQAGIRTIFMSPQTQLLCKKILSNKLTNMENLLFFDYDNNTYVSPNEINCYLKRLNSKYHICKHIHTHMLRHTFATRYIEAGGSAKVLQKILGHRNIETTLNTYTSVFDKFNKDENQKYINYMQNLGL